MNSVVLAEEMNELHALPEVAIKVLANKPGMLEEVCRRTFLPGDTWFYLWERTQSDSTEPNHARGYLLSRVLTPTQVAACIDGILDDFDLLTDFLSFNSVPKNHVDKVLKRLPKLPFSGQYSFIMGGSLDAKASKEVLKGYEYYEPIDALVDLLSWYAYKSGEETTDEEIVEHLDTLTEDPSYHRRAPGLTNTLCYLFSRRPEIAKLYKGRTEIASRIHLAIIQTEAVFHVDAESLNRWFNKDSEFQARFKRAYADEQGPALDNFEPGRVPKNFASMISGKSNYDATRGPTTVQRLEVILSLPAPLAADALLSGFLLEPSVLANIDSHKKEFSGVQNQLAAPLGFAISSPLGAKRWLEEEERLKRQDGLVGPEQLTATLSDGWHREFAIGAMLSLKNADATTWSTFLTLGENYEGTLSDLLRTCQALK